MSTSLCSRHACPLFPAQLPYLPFLPLLWKKHVIGLKVYTLVSSTNPVPKSASYPFFLPLKWAACSCQGPPQRTGGQPVLQRAPRWQLPLWQRQKKFAGWRKKKKNTINLTGRRTAWSTKTIFKMHGGTDGSAWTDMTNERMDALFYLCISVVSFPFHRLSWTFC